MTDGARAGTDGGPIGSPDGAGAADGVDWRARKREETHQRIYATAIGLFQERGYDHVSVGDIAAAAKVSVPTFYAHYPSKEQIVMPMLGQGDIDRALAMLPADMPLAERVRTGLLVFLAQWDDAERKRLLERWRIVIASPVLRNRAAEFERATAGQIMHALDEESGEALPPIGPEVVVTASLSAYTQILLRWAEGDGQERLEDVAERVLAALHQL